MPPLPVQACLNVKGGFKGLWHVQVVEYLPSNHKALSSTTSTSKKRVFELKVSLSSRDETM
jgi:hypothetical protein